MQELARIAFLAEPRDPAAIEVRVNFGIFAGRQVTPAEIDELARALLQEVARVSVIAEERHEIDANVEVSIHQVRVEIAADALAGDADVSEVAGRAVTIAEHWAEACVSERHAEISDT